MNVLLECRLLSFNLNTFLDYLFIHLLTEIQVALFVGPGEVKT